MFLEPEFVVSLPLVQPVAKKIGAKNPEVINSKVNPASRLNRGDCPAKIPVTNAPSAASIPRVWVNAAAPSASTNKADKLAVAPPM